MRCNGKGSKKSGHVGYQMTIGEQLNLDPTDLVKVAMQQALRECNLSRAQVVDDMNRLAELAGITTEGRSGKISEAILDKWIARGSKAHVIPTKYIRIFSIVTGSDYLTQAVARPQTQVISQEDAKCLRWAQAELELRQKRKEAQRLAKEVGAE